MIVSFNKIKPSETIVSFMEMKPSEQIKMIMHLEKQAKLHTNYLEIIKCIAFIDTVALYSIAEGGFKPMNILEKEKYLSNIYKKVSKNMTNEDINSLSSTMHYLQNKKEIEFFGKKFVGWKRDV